MARMSHSHITIAPLFPNLIRDLNKRDNDVKRDVEIQVRVTTSDTELEFTILPSTLGRELFDQAVKSVGLREMWYFGLEFTDEDDVKTWLRGHKKILQQHVKKGDGGRLDFKLRVKFYPESADAELIQALTVRYFYRHVREQILNDEIYCPPDTAVLMASYAVQVKYGDYHSEKHKPGFLANDRLVPRSTLLQHKEGGTEWERRVMLWWHDHRGVRQETAMREYLKMAEDLDMYGIEYFKIKNKAGTDCFLGVSAHGLRVYSKDDQLVPRVVWPWSDIRNLEFVEKEFVIKFPAKDKTVFYTERPATNKQIMLLCMGNHELYLRRRRPDSVEVTQMREQAKQEEAARDREAQRLTEEMDARREAERKQHDYEKRLSRAEGELKSKQRELELAHERIRSLEDGHSASGDNQGSVAIAEPFSEPLRENHVVEERVLTVRQTVVAQNLHWHEKLALLNKELDHARDDTTLTQRDIIYKESRAAGRDKYKTLQAIQKGSVRNKVDIFENM